MKKVILTTFIALSLIFGSCKKLLDEKPQDFVTANNYFTQASDATAALNAAYNMLIRQWMFSGYYQYRMLNGDDVYPFLSGTYPCNMNIPASESAAIPLMWNNLYTGIQYANVLLDNIARVPMDETQRGVIKGEGLFIRAFYYFLLVTNWGPVPLRITETSGPTDTNIPGSPIKDIYAQILKDLTEAEGLVPTISSNLYGGAGYPAKTTVEGMLARVCLSMAGAPLKDVTKYKDAKDWAQKVVDSHQHSLNPDYTLVFKNLATGTYDKKEMLWEVDFNYVAGVTEHGYIGYLNGILGADPTFGNSVGQVRITRHVWKLYGTATTVHDMRRDWNCCPWVWKNTTTTGAETDKTYYTASQVYDRYDAKYRVDMTPAPRIKGQSPINYPMLRYADVLLMLAEAENYLNGPTDLAYSCVNQVRARAYGKLLPGATNLTEADVPRTYDKDSFLQLIQDERCRELFSEGLRKNDLIRWGIYLQTLQDLGTDVKDPGQAAVNSTTITLLTNLAAGARDEKYLLWPMPASELTYNNLLKQNPGW